MNVEQAMTNCLLENVNTTIKRWNEQGWMVTSFHMDGSVVYLLLSKMKQ